MEIDIESLRQAIIYELGQAMQEIPIAQAELIKAESTTDYEWLINEAIKLNIDLSQFEIHKFGL
jgi:hypothetical protein